MTSNPISIRPPTHLFVALLTTAISLGTLAFPRQAEGVSGFYAQLGVGYGKFTGSKLITEETPSGNDLPVLGQGCCPTAGLTPGLRMGYSFLGFGGIEAGILGNIWNVSGGNGGAGFLGGGVRAFPLQFLTLGGLDLTDFPIDLGIGLLLGYAIVGKEFAYTGSFADFDFHIDYKLASFINIGVKFDFVLPSYSDFVYTDYKNDRGRCLDEAGDQITTTGSEQGRLQKSDATCSGSGPSTTFISPQLVFTLHFDPFE